MKSALTFFLSLVVIDHWNLLFQLYTFLFWWHGPFYSGGIGHGPFSFDWFGMGHGGVLEVVGMGMGHGPFCCGVVSMAHGPFSCGGVGMGHGLNGCCGGLTGWGGDQADGSTNYRTPPLPKPKVPFPILPPLYSMDQNNLYHHIPTT